MERLCEEGCSVTFSGVSDIGDTTARELADKGGKVQFLRGDMAEESFRKELVSAAVSAWGRLDYLVNNAFSFTAKGLDATRADWNRVMNVGPVAYATMGQIVLPHMKQRGAGAIVNMSSISAHIAQPDRWTYNAAKGAVTQLTRCMAMDTAFLLSDEASFITATELMVDGGYRGMGSKGVGEASAFAGTA